MDIKKRFCQLDYEYKLLADRQARQFYQDVLLLRARLLDLPLVKKHESELRWPEIVDVRPVLHEMPYKVFSVSADPYACETEKQEDIEKKETEIIEREKHVQELDEAAKRMQNAIIQKEVEISARELELKNMEVALKEERERLIEDIRSRKDKLRQHVMAIANEKQLLINLKGGIEEARKDLDIKQHEINEARDNAKEIGLQIKSEKENADSNAKDIERITVSTATSFIFEDLVTDVATSPMAATDKVVGISVGTSPDEPLPPNQTPSCPEMIRLDTLCLKERQETTDEDKSFKNENASPASIIASVLSTPRKTPMKCPEDGKDFQLQLEELDSQFRKEPIESITIPMTLPEDAEISREKADWCDPDKIAEALAHQTTESARAIFGEPVHVTHKYLSRK